MAKAASTKVVPKMAPGQIWPNMPISGSPVEIPVIGVTGEYRSGKTVFCLSIAPGVHPEGHKFAGKPRTRVYDVEKSVTHRGTGAEIINVIEEVQKGTANPNTKEVRIPTDLEIFNWLLADMQKIQPGQFDCVVIDPITDFDSGLANHIRANPAKFGLTPNQLIKASGLVWGAVKSYWKTILVTITTRVKVFAFTAHLRDEWAGESPTGRREPKGKDTLMEIASLYLWLIREPNAKGEVPEKPSARILKERLMDMVIDPETGDLRFIPLLPPRLDEATVPRIRQYICNPPNYEALKESELVVEQKMTDDDRLRLKATISSNEAKASESRLEQLDHEARIAETQERIAKLSQPRTANTDATAELQANQADKRKKNAAFSAAEAAATAAAAKVAVADAVDDAADADSAANGDPESGTGDDDLMSPSSQEPEINSAPATAPAEAKPATTKSPAKPKAEPAAQQATAGGATEQSRAELKLLIESIDYPDVPGRTKGSFIKEFFVACGCPVDDKGNPQPKDAGQALVDDMVRKAKKQNQKQGHNIEEILSEAAINATLTLMRSASAKK